MTRHAIWLALALALAVIAGCEPTEPPAFARRSSAPPASARPTAADRPGSGAPSGSAGASAGASEAPGDSIEAPTGTPRIEIAGDVITIVGMGDKNTDLMALDGNYDFTVTHLRGHGPGAVRLGVRGVRAESREPTSTRNSASRT